MADTPYHLPSPEDLTFDELQTLEDENRFLRSVQRGKRTISAAFLSSPSSGSSSSSLKTTSVRFRSFNSTSSQTLQLPEFLDSVPSLEIMGFESSTAQAIFTKLALRGDSPDELIDYVYSHFRRLDTPAFQQYSPKEAMTALGVNRRIQDAITDPEFSDICETQTLQYWLNDTFRVNYFTLEDLRDRLKEHAKRSAAKKAKRGSLEEMFTPTDVASQLPEISVTTNVAPEGRHLPINRVSVQAANPVRPDHYVLYKGEAKCEMGHGEFIHADGSVDMSVLGSHPGGDFNSLQVAWYWTPDRDVGEKYREWAARRNTYSETWLIRIEVPKTFIDGLSLENLWYSADWKEYVWSCRKSLILAPKFDKYWKDVELVKGHICTGVVAKVQRIKQEDVQTKMTDDLCLRIPGRNVKAMQWVFMQASTAGLMGPEVRGKMHIDITASIDAQAK